MGPDGVPGHPVPGMEIWGWMSPEELIWLGEQAAKMKSVAEIGTLHGRSAFMLLTSCSGSVYCIDPWDDVGDHCYGSFMGNCGHFENLVPVRGYSPAVADQVPTVDMTFIDGDHEYESVMADINAWIPKTRKLLCGHDYQNVNGGYPGVAQAVHEMFGTEFEVAVSGETSIWAVRV